MQTISIWQYRPTPNPLPGMKYKNGWTYVDESSVAQDEGVNNDERTMIMINQIENDIHSLIQLEMDYLSKH